MLASTTNTQAVQHVINYRNPQASAGHIAGDGGLVYQWGPADITETCGTNIHKWARSCHRSASPDTDDRRFGRGWIENTVRKFSTDGIRTRLGPNPST